MVRGQNSPKLDLCLDRVAGRDALVMRNRGKLPHYFGADRHFNYPVTNIAINARLGSQNNPPARMDRTFDRSLQDNVRDVDRSFDYASLAHGQG
jgi:hypothetical protein